MGDDHSYDPESGGMSDPGYSYDPTEGGSSDPGPMSIDPNADPPPEPVDMDGAWSVDSFLHGAGEVIGHVLEEPYSTAWGALSMESDETPDQRSARYDAESAEEAAADLDADRARQQTENLPPHVLSMDAPAEPEFDAE